MGRRKGVTVSNRWYFSPRFFVKILWSLFAAAIFVIIGVFSPHAHDPFWRAVVGSAPFGILMSIAFFFLIAVIGTLVAYFALNLAQYKRIILAGAIGFSVVSIVLMFAFLGTWGTIGRRSEYIRKAREHFRVSCPKGGAQGEGCDWFIKNILNGDRDEFEERIFEYVDQRTEDIGSSLLGCFLVWGLFDAIWLSLMFMGRDEPDCCASERMGYEPQD